MGSKSYMQRDIVLYYVAAKPGCLEDDGPSAGKGGQSCSQVFGSFVIIVQYRSRSWA